MTGEDGENQLIQLTPDGQAQLIQVTNSQGEPQLVQLASPGFVTEDDGQVATLQAAEEEGEIGIDQATVVSEGIQLVQVQHGDETQVCVREIGARQVSV